MKTAKRRGKRLLGILLILGIFLGTLDFAAWEVQAADAKPQETAETAESREPVVITLNALGGTITSAVQGEEPDSRAWTQTPTGVYKRVLNSYQRLPNPIAPCYSEQVKFAGWYDSMDYTNQVEDVFVESGSMTLYAKWIYLDVAGQNENMWFQYNNSDSTYMVDVRGIEGDRKIRTTFADGGYGYYCKIGQSAFALETNTGVLALSLPAQAGSSIFHRVNSAYDIYVASLVTLDGTYATMHYIVVNAGREDVANFSLGYAADIMIGDDDRAIVSTCENEQGNNTYIQMKERGTDGKVFRFYVKGASYGITDVDRHWVGLYNNNHYMQHVFDYNTAPTTGGDSAFCCSWINRTIPANSATTWSVKLGVGELSEMGDSSNTVILDANGGVFRDGSEISNHSGNSIPIGSLETPTRIGYEFDGWYREREGGERQTGNITESITLYAHWKEALYDLVNDTVVQSVENATVPKETADISIRCQEVQIGRGESAEEIISPGQELHLSLGVTDGYYLPKSIYVDIEGVEGTVHLTEGTGYQYALNNDRTTAEITVLPEYITGNVIVKTIGHPVPAERPQRVEATVNGSERAEISLGDTLPVCSAVVLPEQIPEHTYHYQWYENSEPSNQNGGRIPGATDASYTFPSGRSLGEYYFYCVVTSERENGQKAIRTSNFVTIYVKKAVRTVMLEDKEETFTGEPVSIGEAIVAPEVSDRDRISYVYYMDEACTERTTTEGSGAAAAGGAPSAEGTYYVKAYVPEDEIYEAAENTPPAKLVIKPREHKVTLLVCLDDEEWEGHGRSFCLVGTEGQTVTDLEKVLPGTYHIYDITETGLPEGNEGSVSDMEDTGVQVTVDDRDVQAVVFYYTATFYNEGVPYGEETAQKPQILLSGKQVTEPEDPQALPGYAFEGWTTEPDGDVVYDFGTPIDRRTDLYAKWSMLDLPYRVEHYLQNRTGGYTLRETEQLDGTVGEQKTARAKEYEGYREDVQNENRIPSGAVLADGSLVLKLYYNAIEYAIHYELDGGRLPEGKENPAVYTVLSDEITLINPEKEGYAFLGWTEGENQAAPQKTVTIPTGSTGDRSYTANWEIQAFPYQVQHYLQDGKGGYTLKDTEYLEGIFGEEKTAEAREYVGYAEDLQNAARIPSGVVNADGALVLKLYYNLIEYTIQYELEGGSLPKGKENPAVYTVLSDEITLINPEKEGYAFLGWTEGQNRAAPQKTVTIPTGSTGDRSYTANWEIQAFPYQVQHYLQDGKGGYTLKDTEYLEGIFGEEKTAEAREYVGYAEDLQNAARIPSGVVNADGALVLKLYYDLIEYTIQYELEGGSLPKGKKNPVVYTVASEEITLVNPVKAGYAFRGWTETEGGVLQEEVKIPSGSTGNRSFTANWDTVDLPYRVEHYLQAYGGGIYALRETEHLTGIIGEEKTASAKEYPGYVENEENAGRIFTGTIAVDGSLVLRLYYAPIEYPIRYELNGGELPEGRRNPSVYTIQSRDITLVNPVRPGYIFAGWTEMDRNSPSETVTIPAGSTGSRSFAANWVADTETPYWVEHYQENPSGDGYSLADRELLTGVTGADITAKAKEYVGFTENTGHMGRIESGIISARTPLVLRLYYDRETYVITFVVDTSKAEVHGKTVQTLRHGQAIAKPFVIPRPGYSLNEQYDGWDREVPANAEGTATYTAQLVLSGTALAEAEQEITKTDTDTSDPKNSQFYPLMLRAYGQEKSIRLKWHRIKDADGYILYGSKCGSDMKRIRTIKNGKTTTCTIKKLKAGTYYKYLIVAYQNVEGKKRVTLSSKSAHAVTNGGTYGNPSHITCRPSALTLKKGKSKTLKPSYKETKKIKIHIAKFRFHSDRPQIASVTKKGKVTAKSAGSCNIYVYAQNGFYKKVKVRVTE